MSRDEAAKESAVDQAGYTPSRDSAKTVLMREVRLAEQTCQRAGMEAIQLKALYDSLPGKLSPEADQALYDLVMVAKRRKGIV